MKEDDSCYDHIDKERLLSTVVMELFRLDASDEYIIRRLRELVKYVQKREVNNAAKD